MVAYLIVAGIIVLKMFYNRQVNLAAQGKQPLLNVSMLKIPALSSGLATLMAQFFAIAALFFVIPVYLQTILGYNALETGLRLMPLSVGLLLFIVVGSKSTGRIPTRRIVRMGQLTMALGVLFVLGSITPDLADARLWVGMFLVGAGFGLLASQLGNVTMSAVTEKESAEVGGLQGVFQNLGLSFGTALIGSVFILSLTSGFTSSIQNSSDLSDSDKTAITIQAENGVGIVSESQAKQYVIDAGASDSTAGTVARTYADTQLDSLRTSMFVVFALLVLSIVLSRPLPSTLRPAK
jgi:hypothetical protein